MYLGIDLGTSEVKLLLMEESGEVAATAGAALTVSRPHPQWSEQDPAQWWSATITAMQQLRASHGEALGRVRAIGLSGQMHGAVLLDAQDRVLRPAILWNDGRSHQECDALTAREPRLPAITGNLAMPGFTAPKLAWVARHEPEIFRQTATVLLPKDYLRLMLTGEKVSEMSDAAGTLWLDVARRDWSDAMLEATGLRRSHMPRLVEGSAPSGTLRRALADEWGMAPEVIVAGGGGDNAASAVGIGATRPGDGFVSLGTSGVLFVVTDRLRANTGSAVHAFCHALPGRWHQMSVMLSAASCLSWITRATGAQNEAALLPEAQALSSTERLRAPCSCPTCPANGPRTTTRMRKACSSDWATIPAAAPSPIRCSRAWPSACAMACWRCARPAPRPARCRWWAAAPAAATGRSCWPTPWTSPSSPTAKAVPARPWARRGWLPWPTANPRKAHARRWRPRSAST